MNSLRARLPGPALPCPMQHSFPIAGPLFCSAECRRGILSPYPTVGGTPYQAWAVWDALSGTPRRPDLYQTGVTRCPLDTSDGVGRPSGGGCLAGSAGERDTRLNSMSGHTTHWKGEAPRTAYFMPGHTSRWDGRGNDRRDTWGGSQ